MLLSTLPLLASPAIPAAFCYVSTSNASLCFVYDLSLFAATFCCLFLLLFAFLSFNETFYFFPLFISSRLFFFFFLVLAASFYFCHFSQLSLFLLLSASPDSGRCFLHRALSCCFLLLLAGPRCLAHVVSLPI